MINIYFLICLIFTLNVKGQSNALPNGNSLTFKGIVQDSLSNEIIPNANIRFYFNEQLVKQAVSNNNGEFKVKLPKGNYSYIISCVGYNYKKGTIHSTIPKNKALEIKLVKALYPILKNDTNRIIASLLSRKNITSFGTRDITICNFGITWKPHKWLVINPSNYMRGPFLVPPKERQ